MEVYFLHDSFSSERFEIERRRNESVLGGGERADILAKIVSMSERVWEPVSVIKFQ